MRCTLWYLTLQYCLVKTTVGSRPKQQPVPITVEHSIEGGFFPLGFIGMVPEALFWTIDHTLLNSSERKADPSCTIGKIFIE